jgi:hypothetical protein
MVISAWSPAKFSGGLISGDHTFYAILKNMTIPQTMFHRLLPLAVLMFALQGCAGPHGDDGGSPALASRITSTEVEIEKALELTKSEDLTESYGSRTPDGELQVGEEVQASCPSKVTSPKFYCSISFQVQGEALDRIDPKIRKERSSLDIGEEWEVEVFENGCFEAERASATEPLWGSDQLEGCGLAVVGFAEGPFDSLRSCLEASGVGTKGADSGSLNGGYQAAAELAEVYGRGWFLAWPESNPDFPDLDDYVFVGDYGADDLAELAAENQFKDEYAEGAVLTTYEGFGLGLNGAPPGKNNGREDVFKGCIRQLTAKAQSVESFGTLPDDAARGAVEGFLQSDGAVEFLGRPLQTNEFFVLDATAQGVMDEHGAFDVVVRYSGPLVNDLGREFDTWVVNKDFEVTARTETAYVG